ncbi:MAG: ribonuclease Y [Mycoplasmatales bacterium]
MLHIEYLNIILTIIYIVVAMIMIITIVKLLNKKNSYKNALEISEIKNILEEEKIHQSKKEINEKIASFKEKLKLFEEKKEKFENKAFIIEEKLTSEKEKVDLEKDKLEDRKLELELREKEVEESEYKNKVIYEEELLKLNNIDEAAAKKLLFEHFNNKFKNDINSQLKHYTDELQLEKINLSKNILLETMENIVIDTTNENVLKQIKLPNDDIKGRLIGRAGRNIRSLENLLGVNVIIDDTPGVVSISSFNPVRRAIGMMTLETLISTGRINQISIEEEVEKSSRKIEEQIMEKGRETIYKFNIVNMDIELVKILGTLYFRSSYGQNVLDHSIECAYIASKIASELGLDSNLAARCALVHDIGKIDSLETGKSHVELGVKFAREFGESEELINAIEAHHGDVEATNPYAVITIIADKMSAGRTGSRRDAFENYMERVTALEKIATKFKGVDKAYALQGGREIRVMVEYNNISDADMPRLALEIKSEIENNITFPGVIIVNIIRETRFKAEATKENVVLKEFND